MVLVPSESRSFDEPGSTSPLVTDVPDVTLPDFPVRPGELWRFWSAGAEGEVSPDAGLGSVRAGVGELACRGLELCPKEDDEGGDLLIRSCGLGVRAAEETGSDGSDGFLLRSGVGLGVPGSTEGGVLREAGDGVWTGKEDGGDEPKLINAKEAPKAFCRPGLELWSGVWVTENPAGDPGPGWMGGSTGMEPGAGPGMGAMGVEVCRGPGSDASSGVFSDATGREPGPEAAGAPGPESS